MNAPDLATLPFHSTDKVRFGDTDRQGHVNNAVFTTFFETGRVELLDHLGILAGRGDLSFVIAAIAIEYRREVFWPGACRPRRFSGRGWLIRLPGGGHGFRW